MKSLIKVLGLCLMLVTLVGCGENDQFAEYDPYSDMIYAEKNPMPSDEVLKAKNMPFTTFEAAFLDICQLMIFEGRDEYKPIFNRLSQKELFQLFDDIKQLGYTKEKLPTHAQVKERAVKLYCKLAHREYDPTVMDDYSPHRSKEILEESKKHPELALRLEMLNKFLSTLELFPDAKTIGYFNR